MAPTAVILMRSLAPHIKHQSLEQPSRNIVHCAASAMLQSWLATLISPSASWNKKIIDETHL